MAVPRSHFLFALCFLALCFVGAVPFALASVVGPAGDVPISTLPSMLSTVACAATPGLAWGNNPTLFPRPTDSWWAGFGVMPQNAFSSGPYPYMAVTQNNSVIFGLSNNRWFDGTSIHQAYTPEISVGANEFPVGDMSHHQITAFDELSVTIQYNGASSSQNMLAYFVQGSPYMTFKFAQTTPAITIVNGILTQVNNATGYGTVPGTWTGSKFKVTRSDGAVYIIYALNGPVTMQATTWNTLSASAAYNGVLRVVKLNDTTTESVLDTYSTSYATGASLSYTIDTQTNVANLQFNWNVQGNASQLMMLSFPHHRDTLVNANVLSSLSFLTVKGYMKPVLGSSWNMAIPLSNITWNAPNPVDPNMLSTLLTTLEQDVANLKVSIPNDFYYWGGTFGAMGRLALIADEVGRIDLRDQVLSIMKQSFAPWTNGSATDPPAYETGYGGVVSKAGANNSWVDFGNGYYNDHHFHYGYHLYGASVIAKFDSEWLASNQRYLTELARDIGNPSSKDPYFPVSRHMDWFAGHSWASGIANGAGTRDQESSGEAINGYYGLYMFAVATGNQNLQDFSNLLLNLEIRGAQRYWHLKPNDVADTAYPETALRALTCIGNVMADQAGAWLFWGSQKSEIASIQILPVTPITEVTLEPSWCLTAYNYVLASGELNDPSVGLAWKGYLYSCQATFDKGGAWTNVVNNCIGQDNGSGNTASNLLYWVATRPAPQ